MTYRYPPPRKLRITLTGLFLLVAILFIHTSARAAETFVSSDGFPEPRVATPDLNLPEQSMSVKVRAAMTEERKQPIRDDSGRIHYIVDLADNVTKDYSDNTPVETVPTPHLASCKHIMTPPVQHLGFLGTTPPCQHTTLGRRLR